MLPKKHTDYVIGLLMKACSECKPFVFDNSDTNQQMFYSTVKNQYGLASSWKSLFNTLTARVANCLDEYPLMDFLEAAKTWVADVCELQLGVPHEKRTRS